MCGNACFCLLAFPYTGSKVGQYNCSLMTISPSSRRWADASDDEEDEPVEEPPAASQPAAESTSLPGADQCGDGELERLECLASWAAALQQKDATWRGLNSEKRQGWASAALDWWWRENDKMYAQQDRNDKVGGTPGTAKYVRFYSQWLPKVSPELFGGDSPPPGRFADLGASPGGLCEYLVGRLGWTGQAFSLPVSAYGFGMSFEHRDLGYADCDLEVEGEWRRLLELVPAASCDFVNGGVVVDRGQRDGDEKAAEREEKQKLATDEGAAAAAAALSDVRVAKSVKILRNELLFGLHALKPGGGCAPASARRLPSRPARPARPPRASAPL